MFVHLLFFIAGLAMILIASEFFTNSIEAIGRHFSFSQAVVGSILAAVGTAMPETILPIVALFLYGGNTAKDIGVGAILGAPFMLSTLAFFLVGLTVALSAIQKKRRFEFNIEIHSLRRDLSFFLVMYCLAILVALLPGQAFHRPVAALLAAGYLLYAWTTLRSESAGMDHAEEPYFWRVVKRSVRPTTAKAPLALILFQCAISLAVMVTGARAFVESLGWISTRFGMDPLLFSLLLAPFATELPEKFNSVTWTWKGRDTLAVGNIAGAMVFQATFPVSVGLLFTDWKISGMPLFSALLAILSAIAILTAILVKKRVPPLLMLFPGFLYLIYVAAVIFR